MPIPRIKAPVHKPNENELKLCKLEDDLLQMGYECGDIASIISIIESEKLDISQFDFPFGSFAEFKNHMHDDCFGDNTQVRFLTKAESEQLHRDIAEGKIWVTY